MGGTEWQIRVQAAARQVSEIGEHLAMINLRLRELKRVG